MSRLTADPRLLGTSDGTAGQWRIADGTQRLVLATLATPMLTANASLAGRLFGT